MGSPLPRAVSCWLSVRAWMTPDPWQVALASAVEPGRYVFVVRLRESEV